MNRALKVISLVIFGLFLAAFTFSNIASRIAERQYLEGLVPPAYGSVKLQSTTSLVTGVGPGDFDAQLAFFTLPSDTASLISKGEVSWLEQADLPARGRRSARDGEWFPTPLAKTSFAWMDEENCTSGERMVPYAGHSCPGIAAYLSGYGFLDKLAVSKSRIVDEILLGEGSYISQRQAGFLIVSPERRLVLFAHAG